MSQSLTARALPWPGRVRLGWRRVQVRQLRRFATAAC